MRRHVQMYNVALCLDIKSDDKQMIMEGKRSIVCLLKSGEKNQIRKAVKCEEKIPKKLILAIEVIDNRATCSYLLYYFSIFSPPG